MARAALPGRLIPARTLTWQLGRVAELVDETPRCKSIAFELPEWGGHRAGQHVDIRLTAQDGYQAQRSYSIASAPEDGRDGRVVLTVERLDDGEVSPYLVDELRVGDEIELRGPIGGYFVWEQELGGPLLLVAGGSGIVPLRSILRHWAAGSRRTSVRLLYSARALEDIIYRDELTGLGADGAAEIRLTLTRAWPEDWAGGRGRLDRDVLHDVVWSPETRPLVYVCGPTGFVESVTSGLVELGHDPGRIRTERFGPTGT